MSKPQWENRVVEQTILVVDDDPITGAMVTGALHGHFKVVVENSGAMAVNKALDVNPTLMLLDLKMPNVDGFEVLYQLKQNPLTARTPVICMSGDSDDASRRRAYALGASGYLVKPLDIKSLAKDLGILLRSLNTEMESETKHRKFVIAYNHDEKKRLIRDDLLHDISTGKKVILLSLQAGAEFCDSDLTEHINKRNLIYLQVLPSLITKFPYLQDFSPVISDLRGFMGADSNDHVLYLDDPHLIINIQDSKNAVARIHTLKDMLMRVSNEIKCFCGRDSTGYDPAVLNEMATIFCR